MGGKEISQHIAATGRVTRSPAWPELLVKTIRIGTESVSELRRAKAVHVDEEAPDFNSFEFLRSDELGLSAVLRWMLDPKGSHAQGDAFLRLFLETFAIKSFIDTSEAIVRAEFVIERQRRLDIKIVCGDFAIAIENKPRAGWQPKQVKAYLDHLRRRHGERHCLVVLKGEVGDVPDDQLAKDERRALIASGHFVDGDYVGLWQWTDHCADVCKARRVSGTIRDLARHINEHYAGGGDMEESTAIAQALAGEPGTIETAIRIAESRHALFNLLIDRLLRYIQERAAQRGWSAEASVPKGVSFRTGKHPILITSPRCDLQVVFDLNENWNDQPYVGLVWKKGANARRISEIRQILAQRHPGHPDSLSNEWTWYRYLTEAELGVPALDNALVWRALHDPGNYADLAISWAERLFEILP